MKALRFLSVVFLLSALAGTVGAAPAAHSPRQTEAIAVIRPDCGGYGGPYDCYPSLAAWQADYGGIDFDPYPQGDLVAAGLIAVARIEGVWTAPDTTPLDLVDWTTDPDHYVRIHTMPEARHSGVEGTGYRLETADRPLYSNVAHLRLEGLEIAGDYDGSLVYLRPDEPEGVGEIHISHNIIHGNGVDTSTGIHNYGCLGTLYIWNNVIYDVGEPGYTAGIQSGAGTAYVYNNTIVDIISGFAIRADGTVVVKNNLTEAPGDDFYGSFYLGSDYNASSDDSAPGAHSRRDQAFSFVDRGGHDYHLAADDAGARNHGLDLSGDAAWPIADDLDGDGRAGGWDIGADEETTAADAVPPVRMDGAPAGTLPAGTVAVTLSLRTNEAATCHYTTTAGVDYGLSAPFSSTGGLAHQQLLTALTETVPYTYYVRCQDLAGSTNADDYAVGFVIASSDAVPPLISDVRAVALSPYTARITWRTDEPCSSQAAFGRSGAPGHFTVLSNSLVLSHAVHLRGLDPDTTYFFQVRSRDIAANETVSGTFSLTTAALGPLYYVDQNHPAASDDNPGTPELPWATIQHAADVAQPGDTIVVQPGSYGRVRIEHGGAPGQYITFKGATVPDQGLIDPGVLFDPANPVPVPGNPALNAVTRGFELDPPYGVTETVNYVRLENFEITDIHGAGVSGQGGIFLMGTRHVEIVGNLLHDLNPDPASYGYVGVRGSGHDNVDVVVKDNTLYRVQGTGISMFGRKWLVQGNELSHGLDANTETGEHVGGDSDAMRFMGSGHVIRGNWMHDYLDEEQYGDPHIDCFQTFSVYPESQFAYYILVENNTCDNFGQMLMVEDSSEQQGTGNNVHHLTFRNNVFRRARAVAINGGWADHSVFVNNVFAEGHYAGIGLSECPHLTVMNNIFYQNGGGSQLGDYISMEGTVWDYNIHMPDFSWPPKQPAHDQHSLFGVDPQFVDPAAGDYRLRMSSPAIDRGAAQAGFNYDHDGAIRPQGLGWDVGTYEVTPAVELHAAPADGALHLYWTVNVSLPLTATWTIDYEGQVGDQSPPIEGITATVRAYILTGLANYTWYTVTLSAMLADSAYLADTARAMPTGHIVYLPLVFKAR